MACGSSAVVLKVGFLGFLGYYMRIGVFLSHRVFQGCNGTLRLFRLVGNALYAAPCHINCVFLALGIPVRKEEISLILLMIPL